MEQIRQDLDDADNIFAMVYGGKMVKKTKTVIDEEGKLVEVTSNRVTESSNDGEDLDNKPSFEWLPSSGSDNEKVDIEDPLESIRDQDGKIKDTSEILNMTGV